MIEDGERLKVEDSTKLVLRDANGDRLESWQVTGEQYQRAHEAAGFGGGEDWGKAHMVAVARAVIHGREVPEVVMLGYQDGDFERVLAREKRLHEQGRKFCRECRGT
jgi:hypothetical protein